MSADIVNWLQVNIVNNPQVLKSLIALIILIVASFLMSEKPTEKNPFRSRRVWGALLFVFAIFVFLFANIADLADVFIVWATIVLAGAAVFSFEESRRLRKQYEAREERDRKERLLNEIIEWVISISKANLGLHKIILSENLGIRHLALATLPEILNSFQEMWEKSKYLAEVVGVFEQSLGDVVKELKDGLDKQTSLMDRLVLGIELENEIGEGTISIDNTHFDKETSFNELDASRIDLIRFINNVLKEVSKSKTSLLNL